MNLGNLGIALGAGVEEWNNQRRLAREDAAEARSAETFKQQQEQYQHQRTMQDAQDAIMKKYAGYRAQAEQGDYSFAPELIRGYNKNDGAFADGQYAFMQSTPNGHVVHFAGQDGNVTRSVGLDKQAANQMLHDAMMSELMFTNPELAAKQYNANREYGLKQGELGIKRDTNDINRAHYERNDRNLADHYRSQADYSRGMLGIHQQELGLKRAALDASQQKHDWVPAGEDNGVPVFLDRKNFNPANGTGLVRSDGKPVQDSLSIYRKFTGAANPATAKAPTEMSVADAQALSDHVAQAMASKAKGDANFAKLLKADPSAAQQQVIGELGQQYGKLGVRVKGLDLSSTQQSGGSTDFKMPPGYGSPQQNAAPQNDAYLTERGGRFMVFDPRRNQLLSTDDYGRMTGNNWADLPRR